MGLYGWAAERARRRARATLGPTLGPDEQLVAAFPVTAGLTLWPAIIAGAAASFVFDFRSQLRTGDGLPWWSSFIFWGIPLAATLFLQRFYHLGVTQRRVLLVPVSWFRGRPRSDAWEMHRAMARVVLVKPSLGEIHFEIVTRSGVTRLRVSTSLKDDLDRIASGSDWVPPPP